MASARYCAYITCRIRRMPLPRSQNAYLSSLYKPEIRVSTFDALRTAISRRYIDRATLETDVGRYRVYPEWVKRMGPVKSPRAWREILDNAETQYDSRYAVIYVGISSGWSGAIFWVGAGSRSRPLTKPLSKHKFGIWCD